MIIIIAIAFISFVLNMYAVKINATAAFYSPQSRFWELLAGSILATPVLYGVGTSVACDGQTKSTFFSASYFRAQQIRKIAVNLTSFTGVALIAFGLTYINENVSFPGAWAVFPVLGAALLIFAGPRAWFNRVVALQPDRRMVWIRSVFLYTCGTGRCCLLPR